MSKNLNDNSNEKIENFAKIDSDACIKKYYVYILRCIDSTLYTGYTVDLKERIKKHNMGVASKYTRARLPVEMVYFEELSTKSLAMKREIQIKKFKKAEKENMIKKNMIKENLNKKLK